MNIYVRSDLNMRKGKISSQVSHAVVALWLNAMEQSETKFILKGNNYKLHKEWIKNGATIKINPVSSELLLLSENKLNSILIKDQGRTEFKEPTHTCLSNFEGVVVHKRLSCESISSKPAKQTIIANKDLKLNKWVLAEYASRASWFVLLNLMEDNGSELVLKIEKESLRNWLLGAFAKITLKIEEANLDKIVCDLKNNDINVYEEKNGEETIVLATSPEFIEVLDQCTSNLKLY